MAIADELFEITRAARDALDRVRDESLQKPLGAIDKACEDAKRASWSGSNIGYHATVYFEGLQPKPPEAQFSAEWGLMDRWPTHRPHPGWCLMDRQAVIDQLLDRAGNPVLDAISATLAPLEEVFSNLKERAISLLTAVLAEGPDAFIERKLHQVEELKLASRHTIEMSALPRGRFMTRDSHAMSQGLQVAPHQSLIAYVLSATVLRNGLDSLKSATQDAASHLARMRSRSAKAHLIGTNVFLGHGRSPLWRELKDFVENRLHLPVDEFNSAPVAGITTTARLSELLEDAAFAFLIMTAEDEQIDGKVRARENVVHEVGLFQGRLGFAKAIVLLEEGCEEFSNIHGLGQIRFPKGNISAKFEDIRAILEREGLIESS
jgi:predicted nucleotide-binding protein